MPEELRPCPLCGGKARVGEALWTYSGRHYSIYCEDCEMVVDKLSEEAATEAWNRRATT